MNKPFQSGVGIKSAMRSMMAFAVLFLAVGITQSFAQSADLLRTTVLSPKQVAAAAAPAGTNFVAGQIAVDQLKNAVIAVNSAVATTATSESEAGVKSEYYEIVAGAIRRGTGVGDAYNTSAQELTDLLSKYAPNNAPSFNAVRQSTLSLITQ